jgi:hypothetical protein
LFFEVLGLVCSNGTKKPAQNGKIRDFNEGKKGLPLGRPILINQYFGGTAGIPQKFRRICVAITQKLRR